MNGIIDNNTALLLHCENLTDSSSYNKNITKIGTVNINDNGKFGKCLDFTSLGDNRLSIDSNDLYKNIGAGDFTIDAWLKLPDLSKRWQTFFASNVSYTDLQLTLYYDKLKFYCGAGGEAAATSNITTPLNEWFHAAFVRHDGKLYIYINGKLVCDQKPSTSILQMISPQIGYQPSYAGEAFKGYIDEIRFSNIARWTTDFEPPSGPYMKPITANVLNSTELVLSFIHEQAVEKVSIYINDILDKEYTNLKLDQVIVHKYNLNLIQNENNIIRLETLNNGISGNVDFVYTYLPKLTNYAKMPTIIRRIEDFYERQEKENNIFRNVLKEKGIEEDLSSMRHEELIEYVRLLGNIK